MSYYQHIKTSQPGLLRRGEDLLRVKESFRPPSGFSQGLSSIMGRLGKGGAQAMRPAKRGIGKTLATGLGLGAVAAPAAAYGGARSMGYTDEEIGETLQGSMNQGLSSLRDGGENLLNQGMEALGGRTRPTTRQRQTQAADEARTAQEANDASNREYGQIATQRMEANTLARHRANEQSNSAYGRIADMKQRAQGDAAAKKQNDVDISSYRNRTGDSSALMSSQDPDQQFSEEVASQRVPTPRGRKNRPASAEMDPTLMSPRAQEKYYAQNPTKAPGYQAPPQRTLLDHMARNIPTGRYKGIDADVPDISGPMESLRNLYMPGGLDSYLPEPGYDGNPGWY